MIGTDRPFIDRPIRDLNEAARVAVLAGERWGIEVDVDHPLRIGMNALYSAGPVIVRVGHTTAPTSAAVSLSEVLIASRVPIVPPIPNMTLDVGHPGDPGQSGHTQPDVDSDEPGGGSGDLSGDGIRDSYGVVGWQRVRETRQAIDWRRIGAAVRQVHELDPGSIPEAYPVPSPLVFEWWNIDEVFAQAASRLDDVAAAGLSRTIAAHRDELAAIDTEQVICHGDVHQHNVLSSAAGPLLIDWDLLCWAHPAWDHAALIAGVQRWGLDPAIYDAFASGYGRSFADDPIAKMIATMRNLVSTLLLARAVEAGTGNADELALRLRYWRGEPDAPPFRAQ